MILPGRSFFCPSMIPYSQKRLGPGVSLSTMALIFSSKDLRITVKKNKIENEKEMYQMMRFKQAVKFGVNI